MASKNQNRMKLAQNISELEKSISQGESSVQKSQQQLNADKKRLKKLKTDMQRLTLQVSDHAVLRFFERSSGMNIDQIKKTMLAQIKDKYDALGDGKYPLGETLMATVRNGVIVTIVDKTDSKKSKTKRGKGVN